MGWLKMNRPYLRNPFRSKRKSWIIEQQFVLSNFGGGFNNVEPDDTIADNEFTDTKNMRFVGQTLMEKRQGIGYVNAEAFPDLDSSVSFIDSFETLSGNKKLVRGTSSEVYMDNTKIADVQGDIQGTTYFGKYYFVDGHNLFMYDGKTYKVLSDPHTAITENSANNATVFHVENIPEIVNTSNAHGFGKFTVLTSMLIGYTGSEKFITKNITSIDRTNKTITINSSFGYPIRATGSIAYYYTLDDNDSTGYEEWDDTDKWICYVPCYSQLADANSGVGYVPSNPNVLTVHQNRLVISGDKDNPHTFCISTQDGYGILLPMYFPSNAIMSCSANGKPIIDMFTFDGALIVGRNEDIYVMYGDSIYSSSLTTRYYMKRMDATVGFMCRNCGALMNNYYIYLGYDGRFYGLNTPTTFVEYLVTKPLDWKLDIYGSPFNFSKGIVINIDTVPYKNEVIFALPNDFVVVYNYDNMAYTYYTGWKAKCLYTDGLMLHIGTTDGKFLQWKDYDDKCYDDLGRAISCALATKRYDLQATANFKYFKRFMLTTHAYDFATCNIQTDFQVDTFSIFGDEEYELHSSNATFGISEWGKAFFGNQEILKSGWYNLDIRGRNIKFTFSNNGLKISTDDGGNTIVQGEPMRIYDLTVLFGWRDIR